MVNETPRKNGNGRRRSIMGMAIAVFGFFTFILGTSPELFGLDRSPVIGFVQITVFLIGLAIICIGGAFTLLSLWTGKKRTIAADIGLRLIATGYVFAVVSGQADVFGFGSQPWPEIPSFGRWQSRGVLAGEIIIAIGFLLLLPPRSLEDENGGNT
jgi:MFS family permease